MSPYLTTKDVMRIMKCSKSKAHEFMDVAELTKINGVTWIETKEYETVNSPRKRVISSRWFLEAFPSVRETLNA